MNIEQPDVRYVKRKRRRGEFRLFWWRTFSACRLWREYAYQWAYLGENFRMVVPEGFESDGASVPGIVTFLFGIERDGLHRPAWLLHDLLYHHAGRLPHGVMQIWIGDRWEPYEAVWSREDADRLFARVLREAGVSRVDRRRMYRGVRLGGWISWRRVARAREAKVQRWCGEARS
jgi:hypothetical protein